MKISNVHVDNVSYDYKRAAAGWQDGKARYHFWFSIATREIEGRSILSGNHPTIFKNSLEMDHHKAGYFNTRTLDAMAAKNAAIIEEVWKQIKQQNLIDRAIAARAAQDAAEVKAAKESQRQARITDAAPKLLAALAPLYDAALWALTPELQQKNSAAHDALKRSIDRAKATLSNLGELS